jgi:hypothetical protein
MSESGIIHSDEHANINKGYLSRLFGEVRMHSFLVLKVAKDEQKHRHEKHHWEIDEAEPNSKLALALPNSELVPGAHDLLARLADLKPGRVESFWVIVDGEIIVAVGYSVDAVLRVEPRNILLWKVELPCIRLTWIGAAMGRVGIG